MLDAADLDVAVDACIHGAFLSTGQRCTASSRFIVQAGIYDSFVARLRDVMDKLSGMRWIPTPKSGRS